MKDLKRQALCLLLAVVMFIGGINFGFISPVNAQEKSVISNELKKNISSGKDEFFDVMVLFKDGANIWQAKKESVDYKTDESKELKEKKAIIGEMKETAYRSQAGILDYLEKEKKNGNVKNFKSFYIVNTIHMLANKDVIEYLANKNEVKLIDLNKKIKQDDPIIERRLFRSSLPEAKNEVEWNISKVGADQVWNKLGVTGKGITVGIMDSAVNVYHPALKTKFKGYDPVSGDMLFPGNFVDTVSYNDIFKKSMDSVHGSHCMGIILGSEKDSSGNYFNRIGVAPDAKFISARVFDNNGHSSTDGFLTAAQWMLAPGGKADNAPQIISNSWGGGGTANDDPWFQGAVKAWREAGILPVFAAGNRGPGEPIPGPRSISTPASYKDSFAVGATDHNDKIASFSKKGPSPFGNALGWKPEISAPGVSIRSAVDNGYIYMSGTSMACPHISGIAALVKSANSNLTDKQAQDMIQRTATPLTDENYKSSPNHAYGYGLANAYAAVSEAMGKGNGTVKGKVSSEGKAIEAEIYISETDRKVKNDSSSGEYLLKHTAGTWTIKCNAPGYEAQEKQVELTKDSTINLNFDLVKKDIGKFIINVKDVEGNSINGAFIRILEDSNINFEDNNGVYTSNEVPVGNYTLRIFKEGYNAKEEQFNLSAGNNNREFTLEAQGQMQEEEYKYDTGNMNRQADQNYRIGSTGYQGGAVKFIPKKIGGTISSISIQFGPLSDLQTYSRCKVSIKQLDKRGRLLEIMEPMEINFQPNKVKTISVAQYQIKTDEPYYVVVEKIDDSGNILIGLDQSGDRDYSYIYGGNNLFPLYPNLVYGALMIRSTMNYPVDADTINYHVNKPVLDPIHPSAKEVKGKAEAKQGIQLFFQDGLRINDMADANGNFSIAVRRTMIPGEEVLAYAKDENGIKSDPAKGIILTDPEILLDNIKLAKDMKDEKPGTEANKKLKNAVSEAELLLENINSYEVGELIDKSKIKEYQNEINNKVKELRDLMLALSPDKERLKKEIDIAMEDLSNIWISPNGRDIPETKDWVMQKDWTIFNSKLLKARGVYQDTAATVQRTRNAIKDLKDAKTIFDSSKQKGYEKVLIINEKYEDGIYEGEGRGTSLLASHVVIQVSKGRIVDVKITDWNESEASKKAIELEGFLDKIVNENALDIKPIKGYEIEYRAIIKAINQAIEKGLKEGEPINTDKTPLSNAINRAKTFLNKYPVSDGQNIGEEVEWVTQENHNLLKQQIAVAEEEYKKDLTIDGRDKAITILETAVRNFLSQLERGPKDVVVPIGYKDGEYLVKTHGQNAMNKNEFKVTISNGKITSIEIISWADTPGFDNKIEPLIRNIINENSPEVDVVSKATNSSNSVKEAVKLALEMAKKTEDPENPVDPADIEKSLNNLKSEILSAKKLLYKTQIEGSILKVKREFIVNRSKLYLPR